jgi:phenylalanyl-tRNA synthetase beta chain
MIVSVNWLKKFIDIDMPVDELATLIGERLVEIESVQDMGSKYKDVVIIRVVECGPLEGTDHLNLTKIDDGGVVKNVERDEHGLVQVVCGAPNVRSGMLAAWLPPRSTIPETFTDAEPFVLSVKNLRGTMSNGMLASAKELDLFDEHTGILEIDKEVEAGSSFALVYELDDYLLDIENKSLTHRPDAFGIIGFAREVAAISGKTFVTPEWLANLRPSYGEKSGNVKAPSVVIDDLELSARYQAAILSGADASQHSPLEIQTYLARVGVRPINAVVDVTNYLMMLTGQPLHAFDYDKLLTVSGGDDTIHVRVGKQGEKLELLDGREIELSVDDIVIAVGETAIGLAGAMGGMNTAIDVSTKAIIIESATFNLYKLRATQMRHGIFSEAMTRFTKGQPAALSAPVLANAIELMADWSGATRESDIAEAIGSETTPVSIELSVDRINSTLGTNKDTLSIMTLLQSIEFAVAELKPGILLVSPPYWRGDIHIPEDVIEEIGRISGFDTITPTLPTRTFRAVMPSDFDAMRTSIRHLLSRGGANEILSYSFIHGDVINAAGQDFENSYRVTNSISPSLQYYRQTLTPSVLSMVHPNIKQGFESFAIYEMNKTHTKEDGVTIEDVPVESDMIALTVAYKKTKIGSAFYDAKRYLLYLGDSLGVRLEVRVIEGETGALYAPFESKRSAVIVDQESGTAIGVVGEYRQSVRRAFKLPEMSAGFELSTTKLYDLYKKNTIKYTPFSKYPSSHRDICFQVTDDVTYQTIESAGATAVTSSVFSVTQVPIDIYQAQKGGVKNCTLRYTITAYDHTLSSEEVTSVASSIIAAVIMQTNATII